LNGNFKCLLQRGLVLSEEDFFNQLREHFYDMERRNLLKPAECDQIRTFFGSILTADAIAGYLSRLHPPMRLPIKNTYMNTTSLPVSSRPVAEMSDVNHIPISMLPMRQQPTIPFAVFDFNDRDRLGTGMSNVNDDVSVSGSEGSDNLSPANNLALWGELEKKKRRRGGGNNAQQSEQPNISELTARYVLSKQHSRAIATDQPRQDDIFDFPDFQNGDPLLIAETMV